MPSSAGIPESHHFHRVDGELTCDGVGLARIAAEVGTPTFVYSEASIEEAYRRIDQSLDFGPHTIAYAVKANGTLAVLKALGKLGAGADIVSGGELARCLRAGIDPSRIVFSGVGKQDDELEAALQASIRSIHVESPSELEAIDSIAKRLNLKAPISLRVNPDVDAQTHPYIATGLHHTKFGLELDVAEALLPRIMASAHLNLEGVSCHIGSQLSSPAPLREAVEITARFAKKCEGAGAAIRSLDAGGGWPITYGDEERAFPNESFFADAIRGGIGAAGYAPGTLEILVEPGRALVGEAGLLLARVVHVKEQLDQRFIIVDAAMSELIRPALYQAHHAIEKVAPDPTNEGWKLADVVGPVCETGDFFAQNRPMPPVERGELIAIHSAGAYGMSMASNYNARRRAAEVMVKDGAYRVIRDRETPEDLWRGEHI